MKVTEAQHGRYRLRAAKLGDTFVARAFHGSDRGIVGEATGVDAEAALTALRHRLSADDARRAEGRRMTAQGWAVPTEAEFTEAWLRARARLSKAQLDMVDAHAKSGDHGMTAGQIAAAGGYSNYETANAIYGRVGKIFAEELEVPAPASSVADREVQTGVIADAGTERDGQFVWVMHPEVRAALGLL